MTRVSPLAHGKPPMPIDPTLAPLTETITISGDAYHGLAAHFWNGPHRVLIGTARGGSQYLARDGVALRECLPGVRAEDVLDLLAAGKCGDFAVEVHTVRPAARRDVDFGGAF